LTLRWNEAEAFTVVALPGGNEHHIRVLEHPDNLLNADQSADPNEKQNVKSKRRNKDRIHAGDMMSDQLSKNDERSAQ
jgi:hypothetical protein